MKTTHDSQVRPGLLVSVRNANEALAALDGGADVIDVKEPERGPLGAADRSIMAAVVDAVNGRAPVTVALGELSQLTSHQQLTIPSGVLFFKIGLAGCRSLTEWQSLWYQTNTRYAANGARPVAVAYADWRAADSPRPNEVLHAAIEAGCPALLVDTWDKSAGTLFDHWQAEEIARFLQSARLNGLFGVLAGSLADENLTVATKLGPDLIGVRSAACIGGRRGTVSAERIRSLRHAIAACRVTDNDAKPTRDVASLSEAETGPATQALKASQTLYNTGHDAFFS